MEYSVNSALHSERVWDRSHMKTQPMAENPANTLEEIARLAGVRVGDRFAALEPIRQFVAWGRALL